jgi:hypothetical protein
LRSCVTLFSRHAKPLHRLRIVFRHSFASGIAETQGALRVCVTLFSRHAKPLHRLRVVFGHSYAVGIAETQEVLPVCVTLFGTSAIPLNIFFRYLLRVGTAKAQKERKALEQSHSLIDNTRALNDKQNCAAIG